MHEENEIKGQSFEPEQDTNILSMADQREIESVHANSLEKYPVTPRVSLSEMTVMACVFMTFINIFEVTITLNVFLSIFDVKDPPLWKLLLVTGLFLLGYCVGATFPIGMNQMIPLQGCWCVTMVPNVIALIASFFYKRSTFQAIYFIAVFMVALSQGMLFPTMHIMLANWTQPSHRGFITPIVY